MKTLMLTLMLTLTALAAETAFAEPRQLTCTTGNSFQSFTATLDDSHFDPGSGFFEVTNPHYLDNYLSIPGLTCTGHTLKEVDCVGFPFGSGAHVAEVTLVERDGQYSAKFTTLKGSPLPMYNGPWPCTVE